MKQTERITAWKTSVSPSASSALWIGTPAGAAIGNHVTLLPRNPPDYCAPTDAVPLHEPVEGISIVTSIDSINW